MGVGRWVSLACAVALAGCGGSAKQDSSTVKPTATPGEQGGTTTPPVVTPPATPPVVTPPDTPPVVTPPVTPPVVTPPVTPPVVTPPPPKLEAPLSVDGWTFYGPAQGLPDEVYDVSADEGGNVYVAGGAAVYAKPAGAAATPEKDLFARFDAANAGITQNCYQGLDPFTATAAELDRRSHPEAPGAPAMCPVISIGGSTPGKVVVGFSGYGTDGDLDGEWAKDSGGLDVLDFDAAAGKLSRSRHVHIATPPGVICGTFEQSATPNASAACVGWDEFMLYGRRKLHKVYRLVVNHEVGTPQHGDVWMGGTHASLAAFFNDQAEQRGWYGNTWIKNCPTAKGADPSVCPKFSDPVTGSWNVFEHEHPAFNGKSFANNPNVPMGPNFTGDTWAMALSPTGQPWAHNGLRLAAIHGDTASLGGGVYMDWNQVFDLWPDSPSTPTLDSSLTNPDSVQSMTFCPDGALWVGSITHGLARVNTTDGTISQKPLDPTGGKNVWAVACDRNNNLWISTDWGEIVRYDTHAESFSLPPEGLPELARHVAWNIQLDEWSGPNPIVYFAMRSYTKNGVFHPGGVVAYSGP